MALETATYIDALVVSNPDGGDQASTADDHLRLLKACLQRTFPKIDAAVSASAAEINVLQGAGAAGVTAAKVTYLGDVSSSLQAQINTKLSSASLTTALGTEKYLTSDFNFTATLVAVTGLNFTLLPNSWYSIEGFVLLDVNSAASSMRWVFDNAPQNSNHMGAGAGTDASPNADGAAATLDISFSTSAAFLGLAYRGFIQTHATLTASAHVAIAASGAGTDSVKAGTHIRLRKFA